MTASAADEKIVVIGAGIVGLCSAYYLQERGFQVDIVDPRPPGTACSFGNAGVLASWSCAPMSLPGEWRYVPRWLLRPEGPLAIDWRYLPAVTPWLLRFLRAGKKSKIAQISDAMFVLVNSSMDLYRELLRTTGEEALIRESCYVHAYRDPRAADLNGLDYRLCAERGASLRRLDARELHELEPALSADFKAAILVENQGRTLNPARLCQVIEKQIRRRGGGFVQETVTGLTPAGDNACTVQLNGRKLTAKGVVVAAGARSHQLLDPLGVRVPLESGRGYHVMFDKPEFELSNSVVDHDLHITASSMETGLRVSAMMEFAGLTAEPVKKRYSVIAALARSMFPGITGEPASEWMGHRPVTPDSLPIIGELPGHPCVLLAFGHGQLGLTGAPMTGRIIAALASGKPLNIDTRPYRVERFA
jgi:D-amino-acid dehydrogenase